MYGRLRLVKPLIAAGGILLVGCSRSDRPAIAPVRGKVNYQGKTVAGASVVFLCPGAPRLAVGTTDEQGNYRLTTYEPDDGAVIGTHAVTVKKYKTEPEASAVAVAQNMDQQELSKAIADSMRQSARQVANTEKSGSLLPAKYSQLKTTDLRKEVVAGENVIDIDLAD